MRSAARALALVVSLSLAVPAVAECPTDTIAIAGKVEGGSAGNTLAVQLIFGAKGKMVERPAPTEVDESSFALDIPFSTRKRKHYPLVPLSGVGETCTRIPQKVLVELVHEGRVLDEAALDFRRSFAGDLKTGKFAIRRGLVLHGSRIP
jgi:hypothetical protein